MKSCLRIAILAIAVLLAQVTWVLAGVTGSLNGTVLQEQTHAPVAQAKVTASSASQTSSTNTDNGGHFGFVSLVPDTYTVTVDKEGSIESFVQRGVTVLADQVQNLTILAKPAIKTLATVTTRASTDLVKPGTTANVYSVNPAAQARSAVLGGGGGSNQGYSAIAALPGAYVPPGQTGWFQTVNIRGGDYDQVGYEFDGVPINRSFDNYASSNLSAIGQQELQLYTGATPATAEGAGLSGYINQVIKSGTYPGYATVDLGIGGPSLYNKASIEFGGATPNRNFSYYVGLGIINQRPRYYDQSNGASQNADWGLVYDMQVPATGCGAANASNFTLCYANGANTILGVPAGPGGYYLGGVNVLTIKSTEDRENVFNFHFGLPHKNDPGKDDIQLLYDTFQLYTNYVQSPNDWGGGPQFFSNNTLGAILGPTQPQWTSGYQYLTNVGTLFTAADPTQAGKIVPYAFPSSGAFAPQNIPGDYPSGYSNGMSIYKLQYQHNIGTQSYLRLYGYIDYSWWYIHDPMAAWNLDFGLAPDYELWTHTRGGSLNYVNQLSSRHLLNFEGIYSTASTVRDNNTQMFNAGGTRAVVAQLVNATDPMSGICYNAANPGVASSCLKGVRGLDNSGGAGCVVNPAVPCGANYLTFNTGCHENCLGGIASGGVPAPSSTACGGPCGWLVSENGPYATYNTVSPRFWGVSLQDTWKPNDRLNINLGLRDDIYTFGFSPTGGGTRDFWFNAWNAVSCVNRLFNGGNPFDMTSFGVPAGTACSSPTLAANIHAATGFTGTFAPATLTNSTADGGSVTYNILEPRLSGTYTFDSNNVLRFSAGRYSLPANAAFQQYNALEQDLPEVLLGSLFYKYGFTTPNHMVSPSISYNYDMSWEHQFPNTQTSFVITPFLRQTTNQVQSLYIAPTQAFVSGLNVGNETNMGLEFLANFGNFSNNGLAAQLSYTYTHSYIRYSPLPNGLSVLAQDNSDIQHYNSFTKACAAATPSNSPTSLCGPYGNANAVATEVSGVANPYFNAPAQSLLDPNGHYAPYNIVPVGVQLSSIGYVVPNVATLIFQWKHDKWAFTPSLQFHAGQPYGAPETTYGFDPSSCGALAGGAGLAGDPRYPFGGTGTQADATSCTGSLVIPDPYTGKFDQPGAFVEPSQFSLHMGITYEATPRVTYQLNMANIVNVCRGGSQEPWTINNGYWCLYSNSPSFIPPVGNFYNPGDTIQPQFKYPYVPNAWGDNGITTGAVIPFNATFNVQIKM
ncbi:MAG TPA: TonB-dependent receptor [Candidatus Binatus sp.]|nr:TonB-dependent receptor [Candidatus Binatus sp.]